jgi:hypothetical protein
MSTLRPCVPPKSPIATGSRPAATVRRTSEVQLLGHRDEVAQLPKLDRILHGTGY